MILNLKFPGIPFSKQSVRVSPMYKKNGDPVMYQCKKTRRMRVLITYHQDKKTKDKERDIKVMSMRQIPKDFIPFSGAVIIRRLIFTFPPLKNTPKYKLAEMANGVTFPKTTAPDLNDNLKKGLMDALEGIVFLNDSQICEEHHTSKVFGLKPGIELEIEGI